MARSSTHKAVDACLIRSLPAFEATHRGRFGLWNGSFGRRWFGLWGISFGFFFDDDVLVRGSENHKIKVKETNVCSVISK